MSVRGDAIGHEEPTWGKEANYLIHAPTNGLEGVSKEQLWAKQVKENKSMICSIPFFVYHLSLGDEVVTYAQSTSAHFVHYITSQSAHHTFRVRINDRKIAADLLQQLQQYECLFEWFGKDFLAIDTEEKHAEAVATLLWRTQRLGVLIYEDADAEDVGVCIAKNL